MSNPKSVYLTRLGAFATASLSLACCTLLSGCLVAGYGTNSGGFILPGGLGLVFVLGLLLWFLLRKP